MIELILFLISCVNYLFLHRSMLTKCMPVLLCAVLATRAKRDADIEQSKEKHTEEGKLGGFQAKNMRYGLILSAAGDAFLFLDDQVPGGVWNPQDPSAPSPYFLLGLVSFLLGHIQYIRVFLASSKEHKHEPRFMIPFVLLYAAIMNPMLKAIIDTPLFAPVLVYGFVITTMGYTSFHWYWNNLAATNSKEWQSSAFVRGRRAFCGALFFIVSDAVLAFNRFIPDVLPVWPYGLTAHEIVIITYYAAQGLLTSSLF